jgi:hypothetical protein
VCTFIPNNTTPKGTITKALKGLTTLANKHTENTRVDDPFISMMEQWFGKWRVRIVSIFTSPIIVLGVMITIG